MSISERIRTILSEKKLSQRQFAMSIFTSPGHVSRLVNGETGLSASTALLIETVHGYAKEWVMNGTGPVKSAQEKDLSPLQRRLIAEISRMPEDDLFFVDVFIDALQRKRRRDQGSPD